MYICRVFKRKTFILRLYIYIFLLFQIKTPQEFPRENKNFYLSYFTKSSSTLYGTNLSPPIAVILVKPAFLI